MKGLSYLGLALVLMVGTGVAAPKDMAFTGSISDKMCGAEHMMEGSARDCTIKCVEAGSKYVLVDSKGKVYDLSDQKKPKDYAGEKVKVTGTLKGDEIIVTSIDRAT